MIEKLVYLEKKIEKIIKKSLVPEDPLHSKNTLKWLLKLKPDADEALKIAALGHDIERAMEKRKVKRDNYKNYNEFKDAHALNSAKIMAEIMSDCKMSQELIDRVYFLVRNHGIGGKNGANVLKDADTISFFDINLPYYFARNSVAETKKRCLWGYKKLSGNLKKIVLEFDYQDKELRSLVSNCIVNRKNSNI